MKRALFVVVALLISTVPVIGSLATPASADEAACDAAFDPALTFDGTDCVLSVAIVKSGSFTLPHGLKIVAPGKIDASAGGLTIKTPGSFGMGSGAQIVAIGKPVTLDIAGNLDMAAGSLINTGTGGNANGGAITITAALSAVLRGGTPGALIVSSVTGGSAGNGGAITLTVGDCKASPPTGDLNMEPGSGVIANSAKGTGGAIVINGCKTIEADGTIESVGGRSGTGNNLPPGGGPVTVDAGCDLTVSDAGIVRSKGQDPGADLVHLEGGCNVLVNGLVESTGVAHAIPTNPRTKCVNTYHSDKPANATTCVEIWAGDRLTIDSTPPHNGEVSADHTGQCGLLGWIDVFARGDIEIIGENAGNFAIHANDNCATNQTGGIVAVKSIEGGVTAGGRAIAADALLGGGTGGKVTVEAALDVQLDGATLTAAGDFNETGGYGKGGKMGSGAVAGLRSYQGTFSWAGGVGDVRPTGTDEVGTKLLAGSRGEIVIQDCAVGAANVTAAFPNNGTPATTPAVLGDNCSQTAPFVADYVKLPPCLCQEQGQDCPICDGTTLSITGDVKVDFSAVPGGGSPACTTTVGTDLCLYATYDTSGATPDTWKVIFDVGAKELIIRDNAQITTGTVSLGGPNSSERYAPGVVILGTCHLTIEGDIDLDGRPGGVVVTSSNLQAGNILIQFKGNITINGLVHNEVLGSLGRPGSITIASCCGNIVTGPTSRIETIGVDPGGNDINILACCPREEGGTVGGDIVINGLVLARHKTISEGGKTPTINVAAFNGKVTIDGTHDFGLEDEGNGNKVRRTSGLIVRTLNATLAGDINIQALFDVNVIGNRTLSKGQLQYGAVAIKSNNTNGQGGDGDIKVVSQTGNINAADRAFDFENRFNALNAITLSANVHVNLTVTAAVDDGAANNAKPVVNSRGGTGGQGGTNTVKAFNGTLSVGANAQVLANAVGGQPGINVLASCAAAVKAGTINPVDAVGDDVGACGGNPPALFVSCAETFGIDFDHEG